MAQTIVQEAGEKLYGAFRKCVPLPAAARGRKKLSRREAHEKTEQGLARFYGIARDERRRRRLGLIGRARVALELQRRLLAAGYPPDVVKQVLFSLFMSAFVGR